MPQMHLRVEEPVDSAVRQWEPWRLCPGKYSASMSAARMAITAGRPLEPPVLVLADRLYSRAETAAEHRMFVSAPGLWQIA